MDAALADFSAREQRCAAGNAHPTEPNRLQKPSLVCHCTTLPAPWKPLRKFLAGLGGLEHSGHCATDSSLPFTTHRTSQGVGKGSKTPKKNKEHH